MLIAGFIFAGMRHHSYLNSAKTIIGIYDGGEPLSAFLKKYFAANKKYGSKDRKQIAALCYDFYRLGKAMPGASVEERILTGTFLCEQLPGDFLNFHKPEWNKLIAKLPGKRALAVDFEVKEIFPWQDELSDEIDLPSFCLSFLQQPDLFLRVRPGNKNAVLNKLQKAGLTFEFQNENCVALPNAVKLDELLHIDKEVVVQDRNSQHVLDFLKNEKRPDVPVKVWDCCAASGGKSILAYDILEGEMQLAVSDIRESILANLKKRFSVAGIKNYKSFISDLAKPNQDLAIDNFQLIICDAPCTGSGTWSRTPEQLYYFSPEMIDEYSARQRAIVSNVIPHLQQNGQFIYITCSVFKKENEEIVNFVKEKFHLQLLQMELLKGYDKKADSMFAAVFTKR